MKRQGDLLIIKVDKLPEGVKGLNTRVLAEGEATGHKHELTGGEVYINGDQLYFRVIEEDRSTLNHPEHHPITFSPGVYKVIRQKEYEPEGWRYVND